MNILHRFTRKSLLANRSRTLVTIIGIILSMALFTAVIEGAYSGQQFLIRSVEEKDGRWLVFDAELTQKQAEALRQTGARSKASTNISRIFWWSPSMTASRICCPSV